MPEQLPAPAEKPIGRGAYLALLAALLGWMFDGFEMGIFSQVGRQAIQDLRGTTDEGEVGLWFNVVIASFLVGAATGGVVFGWLGDRIGRVRAMTLSVFTYAVFTGLCGLVTDIYIGEKLFLSGAVQLGLLRFIASIGMGGEWSLGVALVMEIWPNRSRAFMAGLIGAAANVGYLLVGFVGIWLNAIIGKLGQWLLSVGLSETIVDSLTANQGWRIMLLIGTLPALLTFLIRIFVPESEKWEHEKAQGRTSHWQSVDLLGVLLGCLGPFLIVYMWAFEATGEVAHELGLRWGATLIGLAIATVGFTYPVVRYLQRLQAKDADIRDSWRPTLGRMLLAAALSGVALLGTWGSTQQAPGYASRLIDIELSRAATDLLMKISAAPEDVDVRAHLQKKLESGKTRAELAKTIGTLETNVASRAAFLEEALGHPEKFKMTSHYKHLSHALAEDDNLEVLKGILTKKVNAKENTQIALALGAIVGTLLAAFVGDWIGRRNAYCLLCALSLASTWLFYIMNVRYNESFLIAAFLAGACTASFYGWLPLYLPELFRTNVRATGQGFSFNFGRVLAAIGALQTGKLMGYFSQDLQLGSITILNGQPAACSTISLIYLVGMVLIWFAPETKGKGLPE